MLLTGPGKVPSWAQAPAGGGRVPRSEGASALDGGAAAAAAAAAV